MSKHNCACCGDDTNEEIKIEDTPHEGYFCSIGCLEDYKRERQFQQDIANQIDGYAHDHYGVET